MQTFDNEEMILNVYRSIPSTEIKYFGRFFHCLWIEKLTKSIIFSKSWKNSSSKDSLPPDFHNDRHHTMMEVMRVDDCINEREGKHIPNSFEKTNRFMKKQFGNDYKKKVGGELFFIPDTNNSDEYNFQGYIKNFERVVKHHSARVDKYRRNYPDCNTVVFFICDESNNYVQVSDKKDLLREDEHDVQLKNFAVHYHFHDKKFIDIIKDSKADFIIWLGYYKMLFVNGKRVKYPLVWIYDVKHMKQVGLEYNHELMFKVKEEV